MRQLSRPLHFIRAKAPLPKLWHGVLQQMQPLRVGDLATKDLEAGARLSAVLCGPQAEFGRLVSHSHTQKKDTLTLL